MTISPSPTDFKLQSSRPPSVDSSDLQPSGIREVGTLQFYLLSIPSKTLRHASFPKIHPKQPVESWRHRPSMKFSSAGTRAKALTRGGAWASASVTWRGDRDVFAGKKWNRSYSVILTGRGSPLFHGSRLCRCPAGSRLQTRWWHSLHRHSSLNKKKKKRRRTWSPLSLSYYGSSLHCGVHLFPCFFLLASQAPSLDLMSFLLDTFRKSVISFCSGANSLPHSVSVNQKALFMEITELDCFTEGFWLFSGAEESSGTEAFRSLLSVAWFEEKRDDWLRLMLLHSKIFDWNWH